MTTSTEDHSSGASNRSKTTVPEYCVNTVSNANSMTIAN